VKPQSNTSIVFLRVDVILILCILGLMGLGIGFIYSSGVTSNGVQVSGEWIKQIIWAGSGLILMGVFSFINYNLWKQWATTVYSGTILLLALVLLVGSYVNGAKAWIGVGNIGIQPSEFAKFSLIIMLAKWFDEKGYSQDSFRVWIGSIALTLLPVILVLMQPDLGTAIVFIPILITMAFSAGVKSSFLLFPIVTGAITVIGVLGLAWSEYIATTPATFFRLFVDNKLIFIVLPAMMGLTILIFLGWIIYRRRFFFSIFYVFSIISSSYMAIIGAARVLQGYQMMRLVVFIDPQIDPRGAGWHIIQSVTAIGSGGIFGKGFLQGTQSHYRYLPEQSTDFIFSILAEETGFIGSLVIFAMFSIIIIRALYIAYLSKDRFGTYISVGVAAMLSYHVIQNIGMAIGVMPITGIPLFFLSYGGSSLWTALASIGLLLSIHYRR